MIQKPLLSCDLTELFSGSLGRGGFYGIARVVAEIAHELGHCCPELEYVVFFAGTNQFFSVDFDFELFASGQPAKLGFGLQRILFSLDQQLFRSRSLFPKRLYSWLAIQLGRLISRKAFRPISTQSDRILFSAARPKFIAGYLNLLASINRQGFGQWQLATLLHDFFPLLDQHDRPGKRFVDQFTHDNQIIIKHSAFLFANSYFTRDSLLQLQNQGLMPAGAEMHVAQLAHECRVPGSGVVEYGSSDHLFLAVGCRPGRKNLEILLEAFLILKALQGPACRLVLAGAVRTSTRRFLDRPRYRKIRSQIQILVTPSQPELVELYQKATATLLPSYSEGWGLPASESLWLGTPVLASDTPVMHEVCGNLGLYFSPTEPAQLASLIQKLTVESDYLGQRRRIIQQSQPSLRRWSQTAAEIAAVLNPPISQANLKGI